VQVWSVLVRECILVQVWSVLVRECILVQVWSVLVRECILWWGVQRVHHEFYILCILS